MIRFLKQFFYHENDPNNQDATVLRQNIVHLIYTSHSRQVFTENKRKDHKAEKSISSNKKKLHGTTDIKTQIK